MGLMWTERVASLEIRKPFTKTSLKLLFNVIYSARKKVYVFMYLYIYRVSQEEWTKFRESVPYVELYRYNPKHLYPNLNGYGDNGQRSLNL